MPSDALSYVPDGAQYNELRWMLQRLKQDFPDKYAEMSRGRIEGWVDEIDSGSGRDADQIRDDIVKYVIGPDAAKAKYGITDDEFNQLVKGSNEGGLDFSGLSTEGMVMNILKSPSLKWFKDSKTGKYYARYSLAGNQFAYFEADPTQIDTLFGGGEPPGVQTFNFDKTVRQDSNHFAGNIAEVEGEGNWEDEIRRAITVAIDSADLPEWVKNSEEAQGIIWRWQSDDLSNDWLYSRLSETKAFKDQYPGFDDLKSRGLSASEAVAAIREYEVKLKTIHAAAGLDPAGVTPQVVADLMSNGYSVEQVGRSYSIWKRMKDHQPALEAFNRVLEAQGMKPLDADEMFKFLDGQAAAEVYDIYEAAFLQEAATAAGLEDIFTPDEAIDFALGTDEDVSLDEAYAKFSKVAQQALQFRTAIASEKYGLTTDDLVDLAFGRKPRSGLDAAQVGEAMNRLVAEGRAAMKARVTPFIGFDQEGRAQARSLTGFRPAGR